MPIEAGGHMSRYFLQDAPTSDGRMATDGVEPPKIPIRLGASAARGRARVCVTARRNTHLEFARSGSFPWPLS
jgi:hypothetical protein